MSPDLFTIGASQGRERDGFTIFGNREAYRRGLLEIGALNRVLASAEEARLLKMGIIHHVCQIA